MLRQLTWNILDTSKNRARLMFTSRSCFILTTASLGTGSSESIAKKRMRDQITSAISGGVDAKGRNDGSVGRLVLSVYMRTGSFTLRHVKNGARRVVQGDLRGIVRPPEQRGKFRVFRGQQGPLFVFRFGADLDGLKRGMLCDFREKG